MHTKDQMLLNIIKDGSTSISNLLLGNYRKIGLLDNEMMLIIHLLYFQSKGNFFPGIMELEQRMSLNTEELMKILQRLVRNGYIYIEENNEEFTGKISEKYNLTPTFIKIAKAVDRDFELVEIAKDKEEKEGTVGNIFKIFEQEFGRPLSPMEIELINTWLDKDKYADEIIIYALKEAVFTNKLNFRYIDRILFEWQKKNIKTVQQIREQVKNFRANQDNHDTKPFNNKGAFEFYNWLENE